MASPQPLGFPLAASQGQMQVLEGPGQGPGPTVQSLGHPAAPSAAPSHSRQCGNPEDGVSREPHAGPSGSAHSVGGLHLPCPGHVPIWCPLFSGSGGGGCSAGHGCAQRLDGRAGGARIRPVVGGIALCVAVPMAAVAWSKARMWLPRSSVPGENWGHGMLYRENGLGRAVVEMQGG